MIASRSSVHSVLWLIFAFCNASGLFVLLGAEFIAMTLVVVYVGAVAVLFLFVVMMLGNHFAGIKSNALGKRNILLGCLVLCVLLFDLVLVMIAGSSSITAQNIAVTASSLTNTHAIGEVLYTDYILPFQVSGLILFVAMVSCIVLTLGSKKPRKRQDPKEQLARSKKSGMYLANVPLNQGAQDIKYD